MTALTSPTRAPRTPLAASAAFRAVILALLALLCLASPAGAASSTSTTTSPTATMVSGLRLMNYYPAQNPWNGMWFSWQPAPIDADFAKLAGLGTNTVRVIVQPTTFGYPVPQPVYLDRLSQVVSMAAAHGLRVQLTLFDLWSSYSDLAGSRQWAAAVLAPFQKDPRVAFVELQNEIDPGNATAMSWARAMLPVIRADSGLPVTVSVTGWNTATPLSQLISALGTAQPDFYDLHFYGTPAYMQTTFQAARQTAGTMPLLIGEAGYSTDPSNTTWLGAGQTVAQQETAQAYWFAYAFQAAKAVGVPPPAPWILNDFPALANLSPIEQHFGLIRLDGTEKQAAGVVRTAFTS